MYYYYSYFVVFNLYLVLSLSLYVNIMHALYYAEHDILSAAGTLYDIII